MTVRWALALLAVGALPLAAQRPTRAEGTVIRPQLADTTPVGGVRVVLHQVGRATQGPLDTVQTDRRGRFAFRFPADSTANYLVSVRYAGIEYFSTPLATNPARPDTMVQLFVFDTASTTTISARSRTLVVGAADAIGARTVVDWLVIDNRGVTTRVGADSLAPTWAAPLPAGVRNQQVGGGALSQLSPDAVEFRDDSVFVFAPLSPGEKELLLQYEVPAGQRRLELATVGIDSVDVFVEEETVRVEGGRWIQGPPQMFEGRSFRRFVAPGGEVGLALVFPRTSFGIAVLPVAVAGTALGLLLLSWVVLRRQRPETRRSTPSSVELADRIAALDRTLEEPGTLPELRSQLERDRGALAEQLRAALASRPRRT
ncbi:MAG: hypothetical protein KF785_09710 [Gemmatimonadales bacterium]|nr:hypothetical protein [Gemmatimonadales bacterium]